MIVYLENLNNLPKIYDNQLIKYNSHKIQYQHTTAIVVSKFVFLLTSTYLLTSK